MLCGTHQNQPKLPCFNKNRKAFPTILNLVWQLVNMQQQCCLQTKILNKNTLLNISQKPKNTLINCCLQTYQHKSHDGIKLEVLKRSKSTDQKKPPLIFLHGARRAAWSFEENFLPYFSELGYPSYALSFRGQGGSEAVDGPVAGTIQQHIDDVAHFVQSLKNNQEENLDPVILGHSLGGFIAEVYVSEMAKKGYPAVGGVALLCATPPSGNLAFAKKIQGDQYSQAHTGDLQKTLKHKF
eukprot:TRINITY_DN30106_c0_g1_i10.p4 TRINITY_DN30106_c0_g1~~TRINITY_DN30106_c0_g1_i10.p4  ORF type:complete len:240 (-),score=17.73 TRINITY_DN30106_c0_g1_i10:2825-3544(-)